MDVNFDHSLTGFQLLGSHKGVACSSCHANGTYKGRHPIAACHASKDVHNGQFGTDCASCHNPDVEDGILIYRQVFRLLVLMLVYSAGMPPRVYKGTPKECVACHASDTLITVSSVRSVQRVITQQLKNATDHGNTASRKGPIRMLPASHVIRIMFKGTPTNCFAVTPGDNHNGQFGTDCGSCHKPTQWSDVNFNHNNTSFPLSGGHSSIQCTSCHSNGVYRGTPTNCFACHASKDAHNGQFGTDCGSCHTPGGWGNATFITITPLPLEENIPISSAKCHEWSVSR
jgi:hypothetical protein